MAADLESTLNALKQRFKPGAVDRTTVYYLSLGEAPGEKWTVTVSPTTCELAPGKPENADCVLKTSAALFQKLVEGSWKPGVMDFMSGKIKTSDVPRLQLLQKAFGLG
jgi:putative sterol carrier protein